MSAYERILTLPAGPGRKGEGGLRTKGIFKSGAARAPLITVITVVFNGEAHLEEAISSVLGQTYANLELIVIDGGSTDRSLEIIQKYETKIDYWVSEPDQGISDAFNKGVRLARGNYLNFQGDGDGFTQPNVLQDLLGELRTSVLLLSGRVNRIDLNGTILYTSRNGRFHKTSLLFRMALPHQGLFTHRKFFENYGLFDVKNKFCMDYELLLRAYQNFPEVHQSAMVVAKWRADGLGEGKTLQVLSEYDRIKRKHKVAPPAVLTLIHFWSVFKYRLKQLLGVM